MVKTAKAFTFISIVSLIVAVVCIVTFNLIEPTVDADGFVQEPFFLLPLFVLFLLVSIITLIIALIVRAVAKRKAANEKTGD